MKTTPSLLTAERPEPEATEFRLFLQAEFIRRCQVRPNYRLSSFARFLGCDKSTLAKILRGDRPARALAIRRTGNKLGLSPDAIMRFEFSSPRRNARKKIEAVDSVPAHYQRLTLDSFQVISDWYHYAILELLAAYSSFSDYGGCPSSRFGIRAIHY